MCKLHLSMSVWPEEIDWPSLSLHERLLYILVVFTEQGLRDEYQIIIKIFDLQLYSTKYTWA